MDQLSEEKDNLEHSEHWLTFQMGKSDIRGSKACRVVVI